VNIQQEKGEYTSIHEAFQEGSPEHLSNKGPSISDKSFTKNKGFCFFILVRYICLEIKKLIKILFVVYYR